MQSYIFDGNQQAMTPSAYRKAQMDLLGQGMAQDVPSGISAIAEALMNRQKRGAFPTAPGGNNPGKMLTGLFNLGGTKGLY